MDKCDRCGTDESVRPHEFCRQCGPVNLCKACEDYHRTEAAEEEAYFASLAARS